MDPFNEVGIDTLAKKNIIFLSLLQGTFGAFRQSPLWMSVKDRDQPSYTVREMLRYMRNANIDFAFVYHTDQLKDGLRLIGHMEDFWKACLPPSESFYSERGRPKDSSTW